MVRDVQQKLKVSERQACRSVRQPRSSQRYVAQQRNGEKELRDRMRELALRHPRYGYRRVHRLLGSEGFKVNRKRVHRLWRKEGLKVPQKQHKRRRLHDGTGAATRLRAERMNQVWSFDFCHDRTEDGKGLKIFSVIDEYTRRCLGIEVQRSLTSGDVVKKLKELMKVHGSPEYVRCDNGPEFAGKALRSWLKRSGVSGLFIEPGSPWENGYVESYHARLRDEMLDREEFASLAQAQMLLGMWRDEYNHERPHGSLGYLTPEAFAESCRHARPDFAALRPAGHDGVVLIEEKCCATSGTGNGG
jgi:transposase InsO family protein